MSLMWQKRVSSILLSFLLVLLFSICSVQPVFALAAEYLRNGECYMLIGEGEVGLRGVYRFNNPEVPKYFSPPKYLFKPNSSVGFSVDLHRKIYTFSEVVASDYVLIPGNIKRQVLDSVSANLSDWGYHAYWHYEHRPSNWKNPDKNIYRVGPVGRTIKPQYSSRPVPFKSNGPGVLIGAQPASVLPAITGNTSLGYYPGKNWYSIPNGSWYSAWRQLDTWKGSRGYRVYGDMEEGIAHDWTLYTWVPDDVGADAPNYTENAGSVVAKSWDKRVTRRVFAGCIDGCGGASGSGSTVADPYFTDIAFMPPTPSSGQRTYFYSRPETNGVFSVTLNNSNYSGTTGNPLLGLPSDLTTKWIAISLRDVNTDYVYCLGSQAIKDWYTTVTGGSASALNITAVTVSNQWDQKGGIVYAYDKTNKMLYKFTRIEDGSEPALDATRYEAIPFTGILASIGADPTADVDDIKADGFGSLYFGISKPSRDVTVYEPRSHFSLNDAIDVSVSPPGAGDASQSVYLIYRQDYGKYVYERNIYDGVVREIGHKTYATRYYNLHLRVPLDAGAQLGALSFPSSEISNIVASWPTTQIGNDDGNLDKNDFGIGSADLPYTNLNYADPGRVKLAVVNVPTPPMVHSLGGKSLLDICGPYTSYPVQNQTSTNQTTNLISPEPKYVSTRQLYFYMVENYPLDTGAQNPNTNPDWDGDGKMGGFVSALVDPHSSSHNTDPGRVFYEWHTWLVQDLNGEPVFPPRLITKPNGSYPNNTGQEHFNYFYSPVNGKYIMTCKVTYDWYNYDNLSFGSTINDLSSVLKVNVDAVPSDVGNLVTTTGAQALTAIMNKLDPSVDTNAPDQDAYTFHFMQASASQYLNTIIGSENNLAVVGIVASGSEIPTFTVDVVARIQRCDSTDMNPANDPTNESHWFPANSSDDVNPPGGFHGLTAGKRYHWRMDVASQTNLFFDISTSNQVTDPNASDFNYIAKRLLDPADDMFVNDDPTFVFKNEVGDVSWKSGSKVSILAYLEYPVPDGLGGAIATATKYLIGASGGAAEYDPSAPGVFPVYCTTDGELPPTDPFEAQLTISMTRPFSYKMWLHIFTGSGWIWGSYMELPNQIEIIARTKVLIVDTEAPRIVFDQTNPINLFARTGAPLAEDVGPTSPSGLKNPSEIRVTVRDNNPWEAVPSIKGIIATNTWENNISDNAGIFISSAPTAQKNFKPIFAKDINSMASILFDTSSRQANGMCILATGTSSNLTPNYADATTEEGPPSAIEYRSEIEYSTSINNITIGKDADGNPSNIVPKGYANNTPTYIENLTFNPTTGIVTGGIIKPYKFFSILRDSSGNCIQNGSSIKPQVLNIALHVKDDIPPNPFGIITEMKGNTTKFFPTMYKSALTAGETQTTAVGEKYSMRNLLDTTYDEGFADRNPIWAPSSNVDGYINGQSLYYQSLMSLGDSIVTDFISHPNGPALKAQDDALIPPGYLEDNVEFTIETGVSDNAGVADSELTFKYFDSDGVEQSRTVTYRWTNSNSDPNYVLKDPAAKALGVFRGKKGDYPMAIPVKIVAVDTARDWDYYDINNPGGLDDPSDLWSAWKWGTTHYGAPAVNIRTFKTTIPVYGSKLIIRTLDKGLRNN